MLQNILKIHGITPLDKTAQKRIIGGSACGYYTQLCYGPVPGCSSCNQYYAIPEEYRHCSRVHKDCIDNPPPF